MPSGFLCQVIYLPSPGQRIVDGLSQKIDRVSWLDNVITYSNLKGPWVEYPISTRNKQKLNFMFRLYKAVVGQIPNIVVD